MLIHAFFKWWKYLCYVCRVLAESVDAKLQSMPVLDGDFEAFVTNLGKYNEGELVGEWVKFPTTEEEMQKVFERIGIGSKDEFGQP